MKRISGVLGGLLLTGIALLLVLTVSDAQTTAPRWIQFDTTPQLAAPIVQTRLNGSEGFPLVIDPSIPDVLIDNMLIAGSGLELASRNETQEIDYLGEKEVLEVVYLEALEVGNVGIRGVRALLIEGDPLTRADGIPTYGRIGRAFLEPFRLTVHYPRKLLLLEPSPGGADVPAGGIFFDKELPSINVEVLINGSISAHFVVDATAPINILDSKWARGHELAEKKAPGMEIETLSVGGFTASRVLVQLGEMKQLPYQGEPVGVLGTPLLRHLSITYDFQRGLLWLRSVEENPS
jgi:hypothetical protein